MTTLVTSYCHTLFLYYVIGKITLKYVSILIITIKIEKHGTLHRRHSDNQCLHRRYSRCKSLHWNNTSLPIIKYTHGNNLFLPIHST